MKVKNITKAALIAGLYAAATIAAGLIPGLNSLTFGPIQLRVSEALTVLPFFTSAAISGLSVGCLISNALSPYPIDMLFGTIATLLAAISTYLISKWQNRYAFLLAPLPPVLFNALIVGWEISYMSHTPFLFNALTVGLGQLIVCYGLGLPLMRFLRRHPRLFE